MQLFSWQVRSIWPHSLLHLCCHPLSPHIRGGTPFLWMLFLLLIQVLFMFQGSSMGYSWELCEMLPGKLCGRFPVCVRDVPGMLWHLDMTAGMSLRCLRVNWVKGYCRVARSEWTSQSANMYGVNHASLVRFAAKCREKQGQQKNAHQCLHLWRLAMAYVSCAHQRCKGMLS